jgi:hypothetical protein
MQAELNDARHILIGKKFQANDQRDNGISDQML